MLILEKKNIAYLQPMKGVNSAAYHSDVPKMKF